MLWDVKLRAPKDKAAAIVLEVEEDVEGLSGTVGDIGTETEPTLCEGPWRAGCRRNCRAFAKAFSWVRTKLASCLMNISPSSESMVGSEDTGHQGRDGKVGEMGIEGGRKGASGVSIVHARRRHHSRSSEGVRFERIKTLEELFLEFTLEGRR